MAKTHIVKLDDGKFTIFKNTQTASVIVKPERTITPGDIVVFENNAGEQITTNINEVTDRPGLMKGWVLLETSVKEI